MSIAFYLRRSSVRLPVGALGMFALVLAAEGFIGRREGRAFTTQVVAQWQLAGRAARREATRGELLCFGDSLVVFDVAPRVLEARTGRRAYNLAAMGSQSSTSYLLLRRALEAGARPSAVVVDFMPNF